jgi:hypothetical protein
MATRSLWFLCCIIEGTKMRWHDHIGARVNLYLGVEVTETENREVT